MPNTDYVKFIEYNSDLMLPVDYNFDHLLRSFNWMHHPQLIFAIIHAVVSVIHAN